MRAFLILLTVSCAGCASPSADTSKHPSPATATHSHATGAVDDSLVVVPAAQPGPTVPRPPAMSKEDVTALVKSIVAEELAQRDRQRAKSAAAGAQQRASDQASIEEAAERAAQQAVAEATEQSARAAAQTSERAAQTARQEDEALAHFLLLPDELDRVERVKEKLDSDSLWGLSLQDLDFAAEGLAAPLLHDALYQAAERFDPAIEMDVLSRKASLTPQEKIQFATMPPIERQQLLTFTQQLDKGEKSVAGDRYVREFIGRYPFIRKILLPYLHQAEPAK